MSVLARVTDSLKNLVANLGTDRDKATGSSYSATYLSDEELINAYRGAWLPRKIVDIPAEDSCRRWRAWNAEADQITALEAEERRLNVQGRVLEALRKARLFGGAAILIGTGDSDPAQPLRPDSVRRGGIRHLTVLTRRYLTAGELETDPYSPGYNRPKFYRINTTGKQVPEIHPSRLVLLNGAEHPEPELGGMFAGWGDSVLQAVMSACKHADGTLANVASLIFEAKVDVVRIPDLMSMVADQEFRTRLLERLELAGVAKGINGMLILDKEEEYDQKSANFSNLGDLIDRFLQVVSGAADIPMTRLLGQSPAGMNSTGESDLRNYYDHISADQELVMTPAMTVLDECLIRSALGSRVPGVFYNWRPLWQPTETERSTIGKTTAETIKILGETRLIPDDALSRSAVNMLVENGVMPGLETAVEEALAEAGEDEGGDAAEDLAESGAVVGEVQDAKPRTLYVSRRVVNADEILAWAREQGFTSTLTAEQLHVTVAFSRTPVDWMEVGEAWAGDKAGELTIAPGGARLIEKFDGGAVVLLFNASELSWRHEQIKQAGASWDWPEYQPHITLTYDPGDLDLSSVEPYRGRIVLGPEVFEEVNEDWRESVEENR